MGDDQVVARELEQAEARLGSAEAYVLDRYGIKGEALDELYDAAIEVGRLRALAEVEHRASRLNAPSTQRWWRRLRQSTRWRTSPR